MKKSTFLHRSAHLMPLVLLQGFLISCTDHENPKPLTPADHILVSETLTMPDAFSLPPNQKGYQSVATYYAVGVQKYKAQVKAGSGPVQFEWVFVMPQADLYDASNAKIGTHYAGPSWKITGTGDTIMGQAFTPAKSHSNQPGSIDWLLLSNKAGQESMGIFHGVGYIFRIATTGGRAPALAPTELTATADIPYTAVYRFVKRVL
jgi:hypothetical protein